MSEICKVGGTPAKGTLARQAMIPLDATPQTNTYPLRHVSFENQVAAALSRGDSAPDGQTCPCPRVPRVQIQAQAPRFRGDVGMMIPRLVVALVRSHGAVAYSSMLTAWPVLPSPSIAASEIKSLH